jgi:hypothetical protein
MGFHCGRIPPFDMMRVWAILRVCSSDCICYGLDRFYVVSFKSLLMCFHVADGDGGDGDLAISIVYLCLMG